MLAIATWTDVALAIVAAVPATIAAVSSLKNGRDLKHGHDETMAKIEKTSGEVKKQLPQRVRPA